ncbi:eukaryotic translation initiation factor 3 subunit A-like isoform X2 [Halichondria panicea]|uniref:eukaryotic translation initiation factor 3 subunit A-like isoform X2 n=1 Tax=Halichondria panicea TaxID=6063 RepID=UPI00312B54EB
MPTYFQKPENALKRANEFIKVGEKESALAVLNDVLRSRKHRGKWTSTHEDIMRLFTQLCIDLHRSSYAKDGLYQYRNICKETNPASFEKVVKEFLENAENKASAARAKSEQAVLQDVEDLDNDVTPESLLLSTVSGEGAKERSDRVLLTPWVKFLWESYRNMLELLKNNNTVQTVYASVAKDAFKFCLNFQRRTEFRKLCDTLHNHLTQAQKYQNQTYSLKFDQPDTVQCLVDVRFEQLESSIKIDLWQEAFRAIEEIHHLLGIGGKAPKPALLDNFYAKQAKVYWMAQNALFHAAALHKLFVLRKEQKKTFSTEEAQQTASQVLLSTLCITIEPVPSKTDRFLTVDDVTLDKTRRLSALLRMTTPPTRASLLRELIGYGVVEHASPEIRQLYNYLEVEFDPLLLSQRVVPILEGLRENTELCQYVDALQEITLVRLIKQVSQVYDSIEFDRLAQLAPFTNITHLEKVVVETANANNIPVRIDHKGRSLSFGRELSFSHKVEAPEGPHVQAMPSEVLCSQLTRMSEALQQAVRIIAQQEIETELMANAKKATQEYIGHFRGDHRQMSQRKNLVESRKEFIENTNKAKQQEEWSERTRREHQERQAEKERLQREAKEREEQRKNAELKELKRRKAEDRLELLKKTPVGARALADIKPEDLDDLNAEDILSKQLKQMEKEKKDKDGRLRAQEKKVDYLERAKRLVEVPLINSWYEEQREKDQRFHEEQQEADIAQAIADRKEAEEVNSRLSRMRGDEGKFRKEMEQRRIDTLKVKLESFEAVLSKAREERLAKRKAERQERRRAEAAAIATAEQERLTRLKAEQEREALESKQRDVDRAREEQRLKQEKREREIEERDRKKEKDERGPDDRRGDIRGPPREESSWRRKSPDPEDSKYPPRREEEPRRAYKPPSMRSADTGGGNWRREDRGDRDIDRRGPPRGRDDYDGPRGRDSYDSPRGGRRGGDDDRGRRDFGGERRVYDDRRPPGGDQDEESWRKPRDDDRQAPPREEPWRRDDGPPRRDEGSRWGRDDGPPRRDEGSRWARDDDRRGDDRRSLRADDAGGDGWRRGGSSRYGSSGYGGDRGGGYGDRGGGYGGRDSGRGWRDAGDHSPRAPERRRDASPRDRADHSPSQRKDDDGFETVSRKR